jgi:hypothetical protein
MNDYPLRVKIVASVVIVLAYLMLPFYGLWLLGGTLADRCDRRRFAATLSSTNLCQEAK